jgi:1-acyl-sn-glycerol-3-phosphate acyltransferase
MSWYGTFRLLLKPLLHAALRLEIVGREKIPKTGPFILVANHQSFLDPVIVQVICPRPLHTLAKSTQFTSSFMGWVMPRVNAIPTRRYRIEAQGVRVVLRRLAAGEAVGVYPEGERSWDGSIQPFRRGTIRVLLKAGVPVVPCGLAGSYDVWPRWSKTIKRRKVRVEFGDPIRWPAMDDREERNAFLPEASETLTRVLSELSAWSHLKAGRADQAGQESQAGGQGGQADQAGRESRKSQAGQPGTTGTVGGEAALPGWLEGGAE